MFDELPLFRATDPVTSRAGARHVRLRLASQQHRLLAVYGHPSAFDGITDEEAGTLSQLAANPKCCYWKRCSELRAKGLIRDTGRTLPGSAGAEMMVCAITDDGLNELGRLSMDEARNA